jgi:hypothetical protein
LTPGVWCSSTKPNMTRRHGHCSRGARLVAKVPHGRWRTLTFLAALRCEISRPLAVRFR